jgi:hypothetical protein
LIEPLDEESVAARFLAENCKNGAVLSGKLGGAEAAHLGTDRDLGVIIEIFSDAHGR